MTLTLDSELTNGGFHQFFWNSEGEYNRDTDGALAFFGATELREIFTRAVACAKEHKVVETKRRSENTWEDFTAGYQTIPWACLDEAYCEASPTLFQHVARYVREHPTDFDHKI